MNERDAGGWGAAGPGPVPVHVALSVLLLVAGAGCDESPPDAPMGEAATAASVREVVRANELLVAAGDSRDMDVVRRFHAPDAVLVPPSGRVLRGLEEVATFLQPSASARTENSTVEILKADASGDLAYVFGRYSYDVVTGDGERRTVIGPYTMIWRRTPEGDWQAEVNTWHTSG